MTGGHGLWVGEIRGGALGGRQQLIRAATRVYQEVMAELFLLNRGAGGGGGGDRAAGRREERSTVQQRNRRAVALERHARRKVAVLIRSRSFGGLQLLTGTVGGPLPLEAPAAAAALRRLLSCRAAGVCLMGWSEGVGADPCLQKSGLCFTVGVKNKRLQLRSHSARRMSLLLHTNLMMKFWQVKPWLSGYFLA